MTLAARANTPHPSLPASGGGTRPSRFAIPLRFAFRDLRGGLRGFYVFIACIALGVMAIAGVNSFASSLGDGLAREGRTILGGDLAFTLIHREADATERAFLDRAGRVSAAATMRAMARTHSASEDARKRADGASEDARERADAGRTALVEIKAVDGAYPLFGAARLDPEMPLADALAERDGVYGAAAEALLLARLDLKPGARITVGNATIEIRATLASEPDRLSAGGFGLGPRLMISPEALRATGLLQPGSQVRWHYRLRLADNDASDAAVQRTIARRQRAGAGCRLGGARPQQRLARARAQHRTLHAIPDAGRPHRAAGRRRRRGERDPRASRPQARHHRHPEIARRHRRQRVRGLPDAGDGAWRSSAPSPD